MMDIWLTRTISGLVASDDAAKAHLRKYAPGTQLRANVRKQRDKKSLNRWWKLCTVVAENSAEMPNPRLVHNFLKLRCGHAIPVVAKSTGEVFLLPDSISYDAIEDEADFQDIWKRAVKVVCEDIIPGIDEAELEFEVLKLIGWAA